MQVNRYWRVIYSIRWNCTLLRNRLSKLNSVILTILLDWVLQDDFSEVPPFQGYSRAKRIYKTILPDAIHPQVGAAVTNIYFFINVRKGGGGGSTLCPQSRAGNLPYVRKGGGDSTSGADPVFLGHPDPYPGKYRIRNLYPLNEPCNSNFLLKLS